MWHLGASAIGREARVHTGMWSGGASRDIGLIDDPHNHNVAVGIRDVWKSHHLTYGVRRLTAQEKSLDIFLYRNII